jgi:hypothetical protein
MYNTRDYFFWGGSLPIVRYSKEHVSETDLFPSSGEGGGTLLGPLINGRLVKYFILLHCILTCFPLIVVYFMKLPASESKMCSAVPRGSTGTVCNKF